MGFFDFLRPKPIPKATFVTAYEGLFEKKIPAVRPISQLNFVVLDTETTGLNPKMDYIISFGGIKLSHFSIPVRNCKEMYLKVPIKNAEAIQVHELIRTKDPVALRDFAREFLEFIGPHILVGHHVGFDLAMLEKALRPFGLKKLQNAVLDTQYFAMRLEKGIQYDPSMGKPGEFTLDSLCERYGITLDDRHTAAGDAFLTAQLLMKLLKLAEKKGIKDFGSLFR
ncbi:3'-5' exonuclease [Cecembia sp.]|uniref:3'-5' exonuclease n=1 Tax=Cecembia sp. TaxID=1898110 RepID=UPI0025C25B79|nr:3'-5' exonuclease [Cecembia sp.]